MKRRISLRPLWLVLPLLLVAATGVAQDSGPPDLGAGLNLLGNLGGAEAEEPRLTATLAPADAQPGETVTLSVTAHLPPGHYTYSTNRQLNQTAATVIEIEDLSGLEPVGKESFQPDHPPKQIFDEGLEREIEKFTSDVTWTKKYRIKPDAKPGDVRAAGKVRWQVCNDRVCRPAVVEIAAALADAAKPDTPQADTASLPESAFTVTQRPLLPGRQQKPGPTLVQVGLWPRDAKVGERVTLAVRLTLDEEWHVYSITQPLGNIVEPTVLTLTDTTGLKPLGETFEPDRAPTIHHDKELETTTEEFESSVVWTRQFEVTDPQYAIAGTLTYQVCTRSNCLRPETVSFQVDQSRQVKKTNYVVPVEPGSDDRTAAPLGQPRVQSTPPEATPAKPAPDATQSAASAPAGTAPELTQGLTKFLIAAVLAGFASLLTPCVFPMVPITVSVFLKQAEKEHHRPVFMASVYAGGIVLAFTTLGMVVSILYGATALNEMANYVSFNLFMAAMLVFFGLNLLGMFELRIPGWLLTWSSARESQGGVVGILFMALTFTLVSFTCTFAFLGGLLAYAAQGHVLWPMLGMLAFSSAFALPFFFLALFPSFLQKLPKSGGWMNTVKVTMGLIEIGAALKFFSVADAAYNPLPVLFDYTLVLTGWMMLAACTGLYLLGLFRLPHDTPTQSISVPRFLFALGFLSLAGYIAVGQFAAEPPTGIVWEQIYAMAPPRNKVVEGTIGPSFEDHGLEYALDYEQALQFARQNNRPVFIDFTGVNCPNCRLMEKRMAAPDLHDRLEKFVRVKVYTDTIPGFAGEEKADLLEKNRRLQDEWYNDTSLPAYAVLTPDRQILSRTAGAQAAAEFAEFLDTGLERWQQTANAGNVTAGAEVPSMGKLNGAVLASQRGR